MTPKGKEVILGEKSLKSGRPGKTYASSSTPKEGPIRRFSAKEKIRELGATYIFNETERCNHTLVRKFYANWDTSFGESTK
ncbi:hypothetical protein HAX54_036839, partial [Datura stramonium]|nr:hypothetical protein [Datura stramonium]